MLLNLRVQSIKAHSTFLLRQNMSNFYYFICHKCTQNFSIEPNFAKSPLTFELCIPCIYKNFNQFYQTRFYFNLYSSTGLRFDKTKQQNKLFESQGFQERNPIRTVGICGAFSACLREVLRMKTNTGRIDKLDTHYTVYYVHLGAKVLYIYTS